MSARLTSAAALVLLVSATPGLEAQSDDPFAGRRFRVIVNGAFAAGSLAFEESRQFREFAETGTIRASYEEKSGAGLDLGLQYNFLKGLGVVASYSIAARKGSVAYEAGLPHPLYLNRPRQVSGDVEGFEYDEGAAHVDLVARRAFGALEASLFGGVSLFSVKTDLVESVQYSHAYPYDTATVTSVPPKRLEASPTGYNVGGRLDYGLGRAKRVGLGLQLRYSRAKVELSPSDAGKVQFDAGGLQLAAGARIFF